MANIKRDERLDKAINFMRVLDISEEEVKPVLFALLRMYNGNWQLIEDDSYQTLVDAYLNYKEDKGGEEKSKAGENPMRKLVLADEDEHSIPSMGNSSQKLCVEHKKMSPEPSTSMQNMIPKANANAPCWETNDRKSYSKKTSTRPEMEPVMPNKKPKLQDTSNPNGRIASDQSLLAKF
ncbi:hypothetical protein RJT34_20678 [Clitoria ternatea]|uniref:WIYLD domain-containing protein n=1 Tax=Clitoria ternatea TaxID=43366 RepID=A0AAN9ITA3_CLITE